MRGTNTSRDWIALLAARALEEYVLSYPYLQGKAQKWKSFGNDNSQSSNIAWTTIFRFISSVFHSVCMLDFRIKWLPSTCSMGTCRSRTESWSNRGPWKGGYSGINGKNGQLLGIHITWNPGSGQNDTSPEVSRRSWYFGMGGIVCICIAMRVKTVSESPSTMKWGNITMCGYTWKFL